MADYKVGILITAKDEASRALSSINDSLAGMAGELGKFKYVAGAATAAAATVIGTVYKLSQAAMESESSWARVDQQLKLAGLSSVSNSDKIKEFASSMINLTGVSDELVGEWTGNFLPVTKDINLAIEATKAALDLQASGLVRDRSAYQMINQAMAGNLSALGQFVPAIKNYTKEQLDALTVNEKQTLALKLLREQFGGLAEVEGQTAAGSARKMKESFNELQESLGKMLLPTVKKYVDDLATIIKWTNEKIGVDEKHIDKIREQIKQQEILYQWARNIATDADVSQKTRDKYADMAIGYLKEEKKLTKELIGINAEAAKEITSNSIVEQKKLTVGYQYELNNRLTNNKTTIDIWLEQENAAIAAALAAKEQETQNILSIQGTLASAMADIWQNGRDGWQRFGDYVVNVVLRTIAEQIILTSHLAEGVNWGLKGIAGMAAGFGPAGLVIGGAVAAYSLFKKRASGGPASGMTLVGESGPELVNLPAGSRVHNNPSTERMLSSARAGGGVTVQINGTFLEGSPAKWKELVRNSIIPSLQEISLTTGRRF